MSSHPEENNKQWSAPEFRGARTWREKRHDRNSGPTFGNTPLNANRGCGLGCYGRILAVKSSRNEQNSTRLNWISFSDPKTKPSNQTELKLVEKKNKKTKQNLFTFFPDWLLLWEPRQRFACRSLSFRPSSCRRGWSSRGAWSGRGRTPGSLRRRGAPLCRRRPRSGCQWSSPDGEGSRKDGIYCQGQTAY